MDCARRVSFAGTHQWIAFFQVREYLVLKQQVARVAKHPNYKPPNVIDFLSKYCRRGGLSINRLLFGTAGRRIYSPQPVTERFLYRRPEPEHHANVIFHVADLRKDSLPPVRLKEGTSCRDTSGQIVSNCTSNPQKRTDVAVFHYYLRSIKESSHKMGQPLHMNETFNIRDTLDYDLVNGTVYDDSAWQALQRLVPKYGMYNVDLAGQGPRFPPQPPTTPLLQKKYSANETVAICALVKFEEAYLDEWVDYHHALGIANFYIYDNSPDYELEQWASEKGNHVTVQHYPGEGVQPYAYQECVQQYALGHNHTWVAMIDIDEMIVLKKHNHILDLLHDHCIGRRCSALSLNWVLFGAGGRETYQPLPFSKRFQYRKSGRGVDLVKSIARVQDVSTRKIQEPHVFSLLKGKKTRDTNGKVVLASRHRQGPTDVAVIHHYISKSWKEFFAKRLRGRGRGGAKDFDLYVRLARERRLYDTEIGVDYDTPKFTSLGWENTKRFLPQYQLYDKL